MGATKLKKRRKDVTYQAQKTTRSVIKAKIYNEEDLQHRAALVTANFVSGCGRMQTNTNREMCASTNDQTTINAITNYSYQVSVGLCKPPVS